MAPWWPHRDHESPPKIESSSSAPPSPSSRSCTTVHRGGEPRVPEPARRVRPPAASLRPGMDLDGCDLGEGSPGPAQPGAAPVVSAGLPRFVHLSSARQSAPGARRCCFRRGAAQSICSPCLRPQKLGSRQVGARPAITSGKDGSSGWLTLADAQQVVQPGYRSRPTGPREGVATCDGSRCGSNIWDCLLGRCATDRGEPDRGSGSSAAYGRAWGEPVVDLGAERARRQRARGRERPLA